MTAAQLGWIEVSIDIAIELSYKASKIEDTEADISAETLYHDLVRLKGGLQRVKAPVEYLYLAKRAIFYAKPGATQCYYALDSALVDLHILAGSDLDLLNLKQAI